MYFGDVILSDPAQMSCLFKIHRVHGTVDKGPVLEISLSRTSNGGLQACKESEGQISQSKSSPSIHKEEAPVGWYETLQQIWV